MVPKAVLAALSAGINYRERAMLKNPGTLSAHQRGFSLLEVMITTNIVAVSLLGILMLNGVSKYSTYDARQRTIAMYIAADLQDRLRLNKTAWLNQRLATASSSYSVTVSGASQTRPDCAQNNGLMSSCSEANLVNLDLYNFQEYLNGSSISGSNNAINTPVGCLTMSRIGSRSAANVTITVSWQERQTINGTLQNAANTTCGTGGKNHRQYVIRTVI